MGNDRQIRLVLVTPDLVSTMQSAEAFAAANDFEVAAALVYQLREISQQNLDFHKQIEAVSPWEAYLAVDRSANRVVGCCGFKGNPTPAQVVEVAYFIFPDYEGQGYATAAACELTAIAKREGSVTRVLAHTLPERNASCRVLEKAGFSFQGEVDDPEDGPVWRWEWPIG